MTGETEILYDVIFEKIVEVLDRDIPSVVMAISLMVSDFEKAILSSIQRVFPNGRARGCWFHFGQVSN